MLFLRLNQQYEHPAGKKICAIYPQRFSAGKWRRKPRENCLTHLLLEMYVKTDMEVNVFDHNTSPFQCH